MAIKKKVTYHVDYTELKPETYRGVFAVGDDGNEIMRIDTGNFDADYATLGERLKG